MKKLAFLLIAVTLLVALLPAVVSASGDGWNHVKLIAGGGNPKSAMFAGKVFFKEVDGYLWINYVLDGTDWCLTETHLHVADSFEGVMTPKGNPIPGKFDYSMMHQCAKAYMYKVPSGRFIAAHAVVCKCDCGAKCSPPTCECSGECETAWGAGIRFNDKNWATYIDTQAR